MDFKTPNLKDLNLEALKNLVEEEGSSKGKKSSMPSMASLVNSDSIKMVASMLPSKVKKYIALAFILMLIGLLTVFYGVYYVCTLFMSTSSFIYLSISVILLYVVFKRIKKTLKK